MVLLFFHLPCRNNRRDIPTALWESERFASSIVRFAVLIISMYGFATRCREGKRPNDPLLASVILVVDVVGLPFIICGDFNEPITKLSALQFFRDIGAVEAFQWFHAKHGFQLPPTRAGATRNDSAIFYPLIAGWIGGMQVQAFG